RSTSAFSTSPITSRRRRTIIISASAGSPPRSATSTASLSTACRAMSDRCAPAVTAGVAPRAARPPRPPPPPLPAPRRAGPPPTQPPLALYSGIVTVGPDGSAEVTFDIPAFAGTVRVMAVAWSRDKVGRANGDVIVRDPVVLTATLPRFLLTGDRGTVRLDVDNVEGQAGRYPAAVSPH